jgi:LemA protein
MRTMRILLALVLAMALGLGAVWVSNKYAAVLEELTELRTGVTESWVQVEAALQQRADLMPGLVEAARGFAPKETGVFDAITSARAALMGARAPGEKMQANQQLDLAVARLLLVMENYPRWRSDDGFRLLVEEIAGKENRIAVERRKYNETLKRYNTQIELFPENIVARIAHFKRNDAYFKTEPGARTAPKGQF